MALVEIEVATRGRGRTEEDLEDEMRERYNFDVEENVRNFIDEPPVRHNDVPDSEGEEDEENVQRKKQKMPRGDGNLFDGQVFYSALAFKETVLDHALKNCRNIRQTRYDKNKISFECRGVGCSWRIYASTRGDSEKWVVRNFKCRHSCYENGECELLKVHVLTTMFLDKIRQEPEYFMPMKIEALVYEKWKITVTRPQCQAARNRALKWIEKEYDQQFERLRDYRAEILESNPNSTCVIESNVNGDGLDVFSRFYVCFEVLRTSWRQTCRPLIGVDACFLKGKMKGQLLVAIGRDGNNVIYPLAWAVVQVENTVNWTWFMKLIKNDLMLSDGEGYIIVSDRQKVIAYVYLGVVVFTCIYHMLQSV